MTVAGAGPADRPAPRPVLAHTDLHHGKIWDLVSETVDLGEAQVVREFVDHPGAVAVIALDAEDRVLLLKQYRHPVRSELWEPPAGLRDVDGEPPHVTAARELAEEADLRAATWHLLTEFATSPGGSTERIGVYLARDLSEVPEAERFAREEEEAEMEPLWLPLDEAVGAVLAGRLHSPSAVVGVLAAAAARDRGWSTLRPV
ncbi:NUDIX hydrolase [Cellulomonas hominis]|uniref:ADP-ribose pyrophosphatase n=1 Tax=Cellulomonas hominis TaxID=156981 RepID=A0A511FE97_9CELL|nr:NUDIX hydrolase [Cellulomonas hominis]MBB5474493.1 ADP-ribose pyrophosphatase [Cellulomonas hominis]MBU5424450.1 NUDIX hydrolase [Cellulomonas hominis]NKY11638.1 NUDIX hydrolase [Cellulomonas hominis]GEL47561.1 NTP pyrophosphohydrolase [Cellulomonas hominis]